MFRAGHVTTLPRQRDHVLMCFFVATLFIEDTEALTFSAFLLVTEALLRCCVVLVASALLCLFIQPYISI